ncbi:MAG: flippase [Butyrivibrio sp.]|jgi:O-antigen/teichoic acid export membrane protein|nr:flippase [Butyrivibrio sp.]
MNKKVLSNIKWQLVSQVFNIAAGIASSIIVTRYLGKNDYGIYSYARAYAAIFTSIAAIGLEGILISRLATEDGEALYFGTGFVLRCLSDLIAFFACLISFCFIGDKQSFIPLLIVSIPILFQCFETYRYLYIARYKAKEYLIIQNLSLVIMLAMYAAGIVMNLGLLYFSLVYAIRMIMTYLSGLIAYHIHIKKKIEFKIYKDKMKELMIVCMPLAFASIASTVYNRVDQIMVTKICGYEENGLYSVAVTLSEYWYFVPGIIASTLLPSLTIAYKRSKEEYVHKMQMMIDILSTISYMAVIALALFGKYIIGIMYGKEYIEAAPIMSLYVVSGIFVSLWHARGITCNITGKTTLTLYCTVIGMIANVILNYIFIKRIGLYGAAFATIAAQMLSSWLGSFLYKDFWYVGIIQTKGLFPFIRIIRNRKYMNLRAVLKKN